MAILKPHIPMFHLSDYIRGRRLLATTFVLLAAVVMVRLGFWQWGRLMERRASNALMTQRLAEPPLQLTQTITNTTMLAYRHVVVTGTWDLADEMVLRNQTRDGRPGVHILTPLRMAGTGLAVLVDRGWIPYTQSDSTARSAFRNPPDGVVQGIARLPQVAQGWLGPVDTLPAGQTRIDAWFHVDTTAMQKQVSYPLLPIWIEQSPTQGAPDLPWRDTQLVLDEGPHLSYALQWWSFAAILLIGYGALVNRTCSIGKE